MGIDLIGMLFNTQSYCEIEMRYFKIQNVESSIVFSKNTFVNQSLFLKTLKSISTSNNRTSSVTISLLRRAENVTY